MEPKAILEQVTRQGLAGLAVSPGLDEKDIEELEGRVGAPVPDAVRTLSRFSSGFDYEPFGRVSFAVAYASALSPLLTPWRRRARPRPVSRVAC